MIDLFTYAPRYPQAPAHQGGDTSRAAAEHVSGRAATLRASVLEALREHGPRATFELPRLCGATYRALQPRTSELRAAGAIADSGARRVDPETGRKCVVWCIA